MMNLACVGELVIDFLPGSEDGVYIRKPGGAPANVAVAVARNGLNAGFCGRVGNDDFGRFLVKTLQTNQVSILCPELVDEAITSMVFVTPDGEGGRSYTFARKPGADMFLTREDVDRANVCNAQIVHAGSCSLSKEPAADATVYALSEAHRNGRLVSFDVNYRDLMWKSNRTACIAAVQSVLPLVDFLKISDEEEDILGMSPEEAAAEYHISVLVETMGSKGARCLWNGREFTVPARQAEHVVDTTGAGDAFWGNFLSCLIRANVTCVEDLTEEILWEGLNSGSVAGYLCVQKNGAMESLPTMQEVRSILEETV